MHKLHEFFLTFCYLGKIKKAPGTLGSFGALVFWFVLTKIFHQQNFSLYAQNIFWGSFLLIAFIYGSLTIKSYSKNLSKSFSEIDHQSIVLDEVVGQILALQITFLSISQDYFSENKILILHLLFCFVFFRLFDITKPSLIGYCDRNLKSGFGVMFDDLLCGIITALIGLFLGNFF